MRTAEEQTEVSKVYNLPHDVVEKYVQFGPSRLLSLEGEDELTQ